MQKHFWGSSAENPKWTMIICSLECHSWEKQQPKLTNAPQLPREQEVLYRTGREGQKAAENVRDPLHLRNQGIVFKLSSDKQHLWLCRALHLMQSQPCNKDLFPSLSVQKGYRVFLQPLESPCNHQLLLISFYYFLSSMPFPGINPWVTATVTSLTSCKNLSAQRSTIRTWGDRKHRLITRYVAV